MSRRLLWPLIAVVLIAAAPREAAAQSCLALAGSKSCGWSVAGPWRSLNFGARTFAPAPSSPWRTANQPPVFTHRTHGDLVRTPLRVPTGVLPVDCDMAKPGDPTLDPKIMQAPPSRPTHSGVIVPVAPCKKK